MNRQLQVDGSCGGSTECRELNGAGRGEASASDVLTFAAWTF